VRNLAKLLDVLIDARIDFVLIGGFASVVHGSTMVTRDLDVCMITGEDEIEKLRDCLRAYNPTHRMTPQRLPFNAYPKDVTGLKSVYLETDLGVLDVVSEVTGVGGFQEINKHATQIDIHGRKCKVISMDDLIASKKSLGRVKDLAVVRELEILKRENKI
jgi:predicted nucleotidyltransferase